MTKNKEYIRRTVEMMGEQRTLDIPIEYIGDQKAFQGYIEGYKLALVRIKNRLPIELNEARRFAIRGGLDPTSVVDGIKSAETKYIADREKYAGRKTFEENWREGSTEPKDLCNILNGMRINPGLIPIWAWNNTLNENGER